MYEDRISNLETRFEALSKQLNEIKEKTPESIKLNEERSRVFDEIRRLRRLQWEEETNTVEWDEDDR